MIYSVKSFKFSYHRIWVLFLAKFLGEWILPLAYKLLGNT